VGLQASQKSESLSGYEYRIVYAYARILGGYLEEMRDIIKSRLATSCGHSKSLARYYTSIVPKTTPTGKQLPLGNAHKISKIELVDGTVPVFTYGTRTPRDWRIDPSRRCKNSAHTTNSHCQTCGAPSWATNPCTKEYNDPRGLTLAVDTTTPLGDAIHEITEAYRKEVQKLADAENRYGLISYSTAHKFAKEIWLERFLRRHNITLPNFGDYRLAQQIYDNTYLTAPDPEAETPKNSSGRGKQPLIRLKYDPDATPTTSKRTTNPKTTHRRKYYGTPKPPSIAPILILFLLVMNGIIFFSNPNIGMEVAQRLFNLTSIPHP
jgi:hypothetical protein